VLKLESMTENQLRHSGAYQRKCEFSLYNGEKQIGILVVHNSESYFIHSDDILAYTNFKKQNLQVEMKNLLKTISFEAIESCAIIYE